MEEAGAASGLGNRTGQSPRDPTNGLRGMSCHLWVPRPRRIRSEGLGLSQFSSDPVLRLQVRGRAFVFYAQGPVRSHTEHEKKIKLPIKTLSVFRLSNSHITGGGFFKGLQSELLGATSVAAVPAFGHVVALLHTQSAQPSLRGRVASVFR